MLEKAASCRQSNSKARQECVCGFKNDFEKLRSAYDSAVAKHANWAEENTVVDYVNQNGKTVILQFPAVKLQLDACSVHK